MLLTFGLKTRTYRTTDYHWIMRIITRCTISSHKYSICLDENKEYCAPDNGAPKIFPGIWREKLAITHSLPSRLLLIMNNLIQID